MRYKLIFAWIIGLAFLFLDFAALHDILRGEEASYWAEYAILFISFFFYTSVATMVLKKRTHGIA